MEPSQGSPKSSDRWYLHVQGRTVGPLAGEEVAFGLKTGEFLPGDKIANSRHPIWRRIAEHPVFGKHVAVENTPRSALLKAPAPPRLLRVKPVAPPKMPPVIPQAVPPRPVAEEPKAEIMAAPEAKQQPLPPQPLPTEAEPNPQLEPEPEAALSQPAGASAFHPSLSSTTDLLEDDPETNAALEAATRELERVLSKLSKPEPVPARKPEIAAAIPSRPEVQTVFLADPPPSRKVAESSATGRKRVIQIELKLPERPLRWVAAALLVFALAYFLGTFWRQPEPPKDAAADAQDQLILGAEAGGLAQPKKTRDLEKFPLPDPSSPTNTPSEAGDPVPRLKAPTRPRRD